MKQIVPKIKFNAVKVLTRQGIEALENGIVQMLRETPEYGKGNISGIHDAKLKAAERFMLNMNACFDALINPVPKEIKESEYAVTDEEKQEELREPAIAMEGMIAHARNVDIQEYISFSARLNSLSPELVLDETNNPLDPEQIGNAYVDAVSLMDLNGKDLLTFYREFNKAVFHNLEPVLAEANKILIEQGVLPDLEIQARSSREQRHKRSQRRPTMDRESRAFSDGQAEGAALDDPAAELFGILQSLLTAQKQAGGEAAGAGKKGQKVSVAQLTDLLTMMQTTLLAQSAMAVNLGPAEMTRTVNESLKVMADGDEAQVPDARAAETVEVVNRLFDAIDRDKTLPDPIRAQLCRSQLAVMKIALNDKEFFQTDQHPVRVLLDEIALAGITWISSDDIKTDPLYVQVQDIINKLVRKPRVDDNFLQELLDGFRGFQRKQEGGHKALEQRIEEASEAKERVQHIHEFVSAKINERLLKQDMDVSIRDLLDTHIHQFLVKLALREGPGGAGWRAAMNTIDILIWTVQADKKEGDRERFEKINAKLMVNLEKVLNIAEVAKTRKARIIRQLKQVQDYTFHVAAEKAQKGIAPAVAATPSAAPGADNFTFTSSAQQAPLPDDDRYLKQVDNLPIGVWLEFKAEAGQGLRCTLAARIDSIDKLYFVNSQGVKVVETSRMPLARELKSGTVKIVSEGTLFNRAMETLISDLRESMAARAAAAAPAA